MFLPSPSINEGSALYDKSNTTIAVFPSRTAHCNGVEFNAPPIASIFAPLLIKYLAISIRLLIAAQCNNVILSLIGAEAN